MIFNLLTSCADSDDHLYSSLWDPKYPASNNWEPLREIDKELKRSGIRNKDIDRGDLSGRGKGNEVLSVEEYYRTAMDLYRSDPTNSDYQRLVSTTFKKVGSDLFRNYQAIEKNNRGISFFSKDTLDAALLFDPENPQALRAKGLTEPDPYKARRIWEKLWALEPDSAENNRELAKILYYLEEDELAGRLLLRSIELNPENSATCEIAGVMMRDKYPEMAIVAFEKSVELDPNNVRARVHLALMLEEAGHTAAAEAHFEQAQARASSGLFLSVASYYIQKRFKVEVNDDKSDFDYSNDRVVLTRLYEPYASRTLRALLKAEERLKADPNDAEANFVAGLAKSDFEQECLSHLQKAFKKNPHRREYRLFLAMHFETPPAQIRELLSPNQCVSPMDQMINRAVAKVILKHR
jgi:tetratricopeptide (TPR) repeat protein